MHRTATLHHNLPLPLLLLLLFSHAVRALLLVGDPLFDRPRVVLAISGVFGVAWETSAPFDVVATSDPAVVGASGAMALGAVPFSDYDSTHLWRRRVVPEGSWS